MEGRVLGFDLETLDASPLTTLPCSFALVAVDNGAVVKVRHGLIDPGVPIPAEASAIHGILDIDVEARGGQLEPSIKGIVKVIDESVAMGIPLVGMNCAFDITIVNECHKRLFGEPWIDEGWRGRVIDVLVMDRHVDKWRKGSRKLTALCETYGVSLTNAHTAAADAEAAIAVAFAIGRKFPEIGNADLDTLHLYQVKWRRDWATEFSEYRVKKGEPPLDESDGDWPFIGARKVAL
jgi:DNA polymerase-3 subunit epsilon